MTDERNRGGDRPFIRPWEAAPERDVATEHRDEEDAADDAADGGAADDVDPAADQPPLDEGLFNDPADPEDQGGTEPEPDADDDPDRDAGVSWHDEPGFQRGSQFDWGDRASRVPPAGAGQEAPDGLGPDGLGPDGLGRDDMGRLAATPSFLDDFTNDDYLAATTREYQGLAEEVARAAEEQVETQAVAASIPGVGSGLIGFEDVTGLQGVTEEDVEAAEQARASDLTIRVGTGVVLVAIFLGSLLSGPAAFTAVVLAVMVFALGEFYATVRKRGYSPAAAFGFLGLIAGAIGTYRAGITAIGTSMALTLTAIGMFYALSDRKRPLENAALTIMGAGWVSLLGFAIAITAAENYVGLILIIVLVTVAFDSGSYFAGRAFGRRAMAPEISPNKTWEGLLGGVVTAAVVAALLSTFPDLFVLDFRQSLMLAGVVIVFAPLGDAAESMLKRALGVKDMGSLLPGHGGMLDRIDALLFVVPAAYLLLRSFGLL